MVYFVPQVLGGHDLQYMQTCGIGYSNILFGLMMVSASTTGEKHAMYFGCRVRKVFVPILLLIFMKVTVPESSFSGHLFGILAALAIKHSGIYNLGILPHYEWIRDFEASNKCIDWLKSFTSFYEPQEIISDDFGTMCTTCFSKQMEKLKAMRGIRLGSNHALELGSSR